MALSSYIYTGTGQQPLVVISQKETGITIFSVKAGDSDVVSLDAQIAFNSQRVSVPTYRSLAGDFIGRVKGKCYAVGLNITTNTSTNIVFDVNPE